MLPPAVTQDGLQAALREARVAEAAHREAVARVRDGQSLRLQALASDIGQAFARLPEAARLFDVRLETADTPLLWIDAVTTVAMAPDQLTYQLREDHPEGLAVLLETPDRREIINQLKKLLAHRVVAEARQAAAGKDGAATTGGYSLAALILAWVSGLACGVLGLLSLAVHFNFL
jgi:hypothetical protein